MKIRDPQIAKLAAAAERSSGRKGSFFPKQGQQLAFPSAEELDALTRKATAFGSYRGLLVSVRDNGYVPTLRRSNPSQRLLGRLLEADGRSVYWMR